jgi:membrane associated rhomboid family serine protease
MRQGWNRLQLKAFCGVGIHTSWPGTRNWGYRLTELAAERSADARPTRGSRTTPSGPAPRMGLIPFPAAAGLIVVNIVVAFLLPIAFRDQYPYRPENFGADWGLLTLSGQWWRLVSANFVHINLSHLVLNLIGLWILGKRVERLLGHWLFLLFYLTCGMLGNLVIVALRPDVISYGASLCVASLAGIIVTTYTLQIKHLLLSTKWKLGALVLYSGCLVWKELSEGKFPHTTGLLIGGALGIVFFFFARTTIRRYWTLVAILGLSVIAAILVQRHYRRLPSRTSVTDTPPGPPAPTALGRALRQPLAHKALSPFFTKP